MIIILYILEQPSSWSNSRIPLSWLQSRIELRLLLLCLMSILLVCLGPPSSLMFVPMTQVSRSIFSASRTAQHRHTSKQHGHATSYVHIHTYLHHIHVNFSFSSLHFFHPLGQAGWLRLFPLNILSAEEQFLSIQCHCHLALQHTGSHRIIIFIISNFISLPHLTLGKSKLNLLHIGCHYASFMTSSLGFLELFSNSPLSLFCHLTRFSLPPGHHENHLI